MSPLLDRSAGRVTLTALGETYVAAGRKVVAAQQAMDLTVAEASRHEHAPLTIVVQATSVVGAATTLLTARRARHPGIRLEVVSRPDPGAVDEELGKGRCEVGISDWATHRSLGAERLFDERFSLACPPGTRHRSRTLATERPLPHADNPAAGLAPAPLRRRARRRLRPGQRGRVRDRCPRPLPPPGAGRGGHGPRPRGVRPRRGGGRRRRRAVGAAAHPSVTAGAPDPAT